jgi:hypothetical protein
VCACSDNGVARISCTIVERQPGRYLAVKSYGFTPNASSCRIYSPDLISIPVAKPYTQLISGRCDENRERRVSFTLSSVGFSANRRMEEFMKGIAWIGTTALMFSLGVATPAFAQEAGHDDAKPAESRPAEEKPAESKPAPKPAAKPASHPAAKPATTHAVKPQETKPQEAKPEEAKREDAKPAEHAENKPAPKPESKPAPKPSESHDAVAHNDASPNDAAHHTSTRSTNRETSTATAKNVSQKNDPHRIPDDKYREHFGREHTFHVGHPVAEGGRYRFAYGGYNFYYTQAWPAGWGYDDDVYVIEINGVYYLMNVAHPGVQLALVIDL